MIAKLPSKEDRALGTFFIVQYNWGTSYFFIWRHKAPQTDPHRGHSQPLMLLGASTDQRLPISGPLGEIPCALAAGAGGKGPACPGIGALGASCLPEAGPVR